MLTALANSMLEFAGDPERMISMGIDARSRLINYSVETAVDGIIKSLTATLELRVSHATLKRSRITREPCPSAVLYGRPVNHHFVLWATSLYDVTVPQIIAAFILCWIPWAAYQEWLQGTPREDSTVRSNRCHVLDGLRGRHFFGRSTKLIRSWEGINYPRDAITQSLYLVVFGLAALGIGMAALGAGALWNLSGWTSTGVRRDGLLKSYIVGTGIAENCSANQYAWRGRPPVPCHY